jgi:hypothetical protein
MMTNRAHTRALAMIPTGPARVPLPGGQGGSFSAPRSCSWEDLGSSLGARPPLRVPGLVPGNSWGPARAQASQAHPRSCWGSAQGKPWEAPGPRIPKGAPGLVWAKRPGYPGTTQGPGPWRRSPVLSGEFSGGSASGPGLPASPWSCSGQAFPTGRSARVRISAPGLVGASAKPKPGSLHCVIFSNIMLFLGIISVYSCL